MNTIDINLIKVLNLRNIDFFVEKKACAIIVLELPNARRKVVTFEKALMWHQRRFLNHFLAITEKVMCSSWPHNWGCFFSSSQRENRLNITLG